MSTGVGVRVQLRCLCRGPLLPVGMRGRVDACIVLEISTVNFILNLCTCNSEKCSSAREWRGIVSPVHAAGAAAPSRIARTEREMRCECMMC
jgi:hypothetical protein